MIAISYRREDSAPITGRIYDRLQAVFGRDQVFLDFDSIPFGVDFRTHISETLSGCQTLLAVIGPNWLGVSADGSRRIDDPTDFVRLEVAQALSRDIRVIPLLIDRTEMPSSTILPDELKSLTFRNALRVDSGSDFHHHIDRLCGSLGMTAEAPAKRVMTPVAPSVDSSVKRGQQDSVATAKDMAIPTALTRPPFSRKSIFILVAIAILIIAGWYLGHPRAVPVLTRNQDMTPGIPANQSENRNISPPLPEDIALGTIVNVNEVDGRKCRTILWDGRDHLDLRSGPGDSYSLLNKLPAGVRLLRERNIVLSDRDELGGFWVRVFRLNGEDGDSATATFIGWAESRLLGDDSR